MLNSLNYFLIMKQNTNKSEIEQRYTLKKIIILPWYIPKDQFALPFKLLRKLGSAKGRGMNMSNRYLT